MPIVVVDRHFPVVYVSVSGVITPQDVEGMSQAFARIFARRAPFTSLTDVREMAGVPGPRERKLIADWMKSIEALMQRDCVGAVNLIRSSVLRGAMTAIFWLYQPPVPQLYPRDLDEALRWSADRLRAAGVDPGGSLEALRAELALRGVA